jgi:hypothetical protein
MATRMQQRRGTAAEWTAADPVLAAGEIGYETDTGKFKFGDGTNTWSNLQAFSDASAIIGAAPETLDTLEELATAIANNPTFYQGVADNTQGIADLTSDIADLTVQLNLADSTNLTTAQTYADDAVAAEAGLRQAADTGLQSNIDSLGATVSTLSSTVSSGDTTLQANIDAEETARLAADTTLQGNIDAEAATRLADDGTLQDNIDAEATARVAADNSLTDDLNAEITNRAAADSAHAALTTNVHGIADTSVLATDTDVSSAVSTHAAVTTNVHGIADTSALATTTDVSTAQAAAESHADGEIVTHAAVTTNVHGIADTSDLALLSAADQTFSGDITVTGNFTVSGTTTTVSTQDLVVNDPMIYIGEGSTSNTADLGIVGSFDDGTYQHSGIVRDASDDIWKLFKGVTDEPSTTINFAQGSLDDLAVNNVEVAGVVFTDGTQTKVGVPSITPIAEKTAAYTLTSTDEKDTIIEVNSGSAVTLTIPEDATVNFPVGSTLDIIQTGTGQVTIAGAGSAVVNGTPGTKLRTQWSSVTLLKRAANSWLVFGDTAA